mgnify:CR=1 FL=1
MLVVHINLTDKGSTGTIAYDILKGLENTGNRGLVFVGGYNSKTKGAITFQSKFRLRFNQVIAKFFDLEDKIAKKETKRLVKQLKKLNPDIVHLHNIHGYFINYKILFDYVKSANKKVVWTLHDCWAFTGHCAYFDMVKCDKWKTGCGKCPNLKKYPNSWFFDRSSSLYKTKKAMFSGVKDMTIVCPSQWLAKLAEQSYLSDYPIKVINNGINLDDFKIIDNHTFDNVVDRSKKIILGVASPFGERKGYSDYISLSKIIDKEKYQIVMCGVNEEQVKELESYDIVGITRTDSKQELAELYSLSYCFVNMTFEDNFPTVNIEALACGLPIITYNTGGSIEVITDNNGIVVEQGDIEAVKMAIYNMPKYDRQKIANNAIKKYSSEIMANAYIDLYKMVIGENE